MKKETLSVELKLPQPGDEAFQMLVDQIAEAVYRKVMTRLSEPDGASSTDLEDPTLA